MGLTKRRLAILGLVIILVPITYYTVLSNKNLGETPFKTTPSPPTTSPPDSPTSDAPTGPFDVNLTLSEQPALNRTVIALISAQNRAGRSWPNTSIELSLFKRTSPYEYFEGFTAWKKINKTGDIPPYGSWTATIEMRVEEPGLYILVADARSVMGGSVLGNYVDFYLNVTENTTAVGGPGSMREPYPPPPPHIPHIIKMEMDGIPAENRPVNLRVTIASLMDVKNATFRIFLPEGFELVSGDLVWQGDLQKAMDETEISASRENIVRGKVAEATLQRISDDKKVRMRATIRARLIGDARIIVFPAPELPVGDPADIDCDAQGLYMPHPLIGKEVSGGWQAVSFGGCLYVRVINATDGIFSEQKLPFLPRPQKTRVPG